MKAFVTGGSGFVGRNLIRALVRRGDTVVALARSDAAARAVHEAGATEVARGDLDSVELLKGAMAGCDVVFHSAALASDWGDPAEFHRINVRGTENVIDAARSAGVPRLVHVSTEAVLVGGPPIVNADERWPLPRSPIGLYAATKGEAEQRVRDASGDGFTAVVVRPRFIWGRDDTTLLPKLAEAVQAGRFAWISGGRYKTSTCHVDNTVEGMLLAAERGRPGGVYFLTDGWPLEFRGFVTRLLATRGLDPGSRSLPRPIARALAAGAEAIWRALRLGGSPPLTRTAVRVIGEEVTVDDSLARSELGYRGATSIEQGLAELAAQGKTPPSR